MQPPPLASANPPLRRWGRAEHGGDGGTGSWIHLQGDDALQPCARLREAQETWRSEVGRCCRNGQPWEDHEFPAEPRSLYGQEKAKAEPHNSGDGPPRCGCGSAARRSLVQKEGPTKERPYWHCETRRCRFFAWTRRSAHMWWQRFPDFAIVHDIGFKAEDLRQGGVGDCWFMSALAVVAERPDLIIRLFCGETARNQAGCYQLRLFLDGAWQAVSVDDRLPCTAQQRRPDGSGLAYSRADGQQLWTPLLEKAYAKAHGSYKAISGGEIAEALLDLTGFPTESVDFDAPGFSPQDLWSRLVSFKQQGFPMGCATAGNPELKEVGLCGNHAYSVLDVREIYDVRFLGKPIGWGGAPEDGFVRLLRIRNPHGVGEWNGDWSDTSVEWTGTLAQQLGRTGMDDGTFWMDFTHFLMAFQVLDVCMAHQGWHARSFDNAFCSKASTSRLCKYMYEIKADVVTTLYAMALQPTKRGASCRDDRKKSYKPGDLSVLLLRLTPDRKLDAVIGGNFFGADIMARRSVHATLDPQVSYLLAVFCFGSGPTAHNGEIRGAAPFRVRLFASEPLAVRPVESEHHARLAAVAAAAIPVACLSLEPAPGRRFRRELRRLSSDLWLFVITGEGSVLLLVANRSADESVCVTVRATVKVMVARSVDGLLQASEQAGEKQPMPCFTCGQLGHLAADCPSNNQRRGGIKPPWRYPAKWRRVSTVCHVAPGMQRIAMVLVCNGMQAEVGEIEAEVSPDPVAGRAPLQQAKLTGGLAAPAAAVFEPAPLLRGLVDAAGKASACTAGARATTSRRFDQDEEEMAKQVSLSLLEAQEEQQLRDALAATSVGGSSLPGNLAPFVVEDEQQQLQRALLASTQGGAAAEDSDLLAALRASEASACGPPYAPPVAIQEGCFAEALAASIATSAQTPIDRGLAEALAASTAAVRQDEDVDLKAALLLSMAPSAQLRERRADVTATARELGRQRSEVLIDDSDSGASSDGLELVSPGHVDATWMPQTTPDAKRPKVHPAPEEGAAPSRGVFAYKLRTSVD